ncbi:unnamed protein product [Lathyrus oleraceus]
MRKGNKKISKTFFSLTLLWMPLVLQIKEVTLNNFVLSLLLHFFLNGRQTNTRQTPCDLAEKVYLIIIQQTILTTQPTPPSPPPPTPPPFLSHMNLEVPHFDDIDAMDRIFKIN